MESVRQNLGKKYFFHFKGRASRSEFWWFMLFIMAINLLLSYTAPLLPANAALSATLIVSLLLFPPNLGVTVRRLHDRNLKGWWLLLPCAPFIYWVLSGGYESPQNPLLSVLSLILALCYLVILCLPGTDGPNRFGEQP